MTAPDPVVIASAARTPLGRFQGELSSLSAPVLGGHVIGAALERAQASGDQIDEVLMGCVLPRARARLPPVRPCVAPACLTLSAPPPSTRCAARA